MPIHVYPKETYYWLKKRIVLVKVSEKTSLFPFIQILYHERWLCRDPYRQWYPTLLLRPPFPHQSSSSRGLKGLNGLSGLGGRNTQEKQEEAGHSDQYAQSGWDANAAGKWRLISDTGRD